MRIHLAAAALVIGAGAAQAQVFTIDDLNSSAQFNITPGSGRPGMDRWLINGTNHMYSQWFWFRVDGMQREERINDLPLIAAATSNTSILDPRDDTFTALFGSTNNFVIETRFSLQGSLPGDLRSDIAEQIRITNFSGEARTFSFFQYCDFDLNGDIDDDIVQVINPNAVIQQDFFSGIIATETIITPSPTFSEVGIFASTLNKLDNTSVDNLDGSVGPLLGRRDYTWAFQWDFTLLPGQSFLISKDKSITPAPGAIALLGLGGLLVSRRRR